MPDGVPAHGEGAFSDKLPDPETASREDTRDEEKAEQAKHDLPGNKTKMRKLVFLCDGTFCDATRERTHDTGTVNADGTRDLYARASTPGFNYVLPTNVYHLGQCIKKEGSDSTKGTVYQEIHYQSGVGTDKESWWIGNTLTTMTGWGVSYRIKSGYAWLCNRYRPGDEIYICGFSRGAFIARAVAGMIGRVGLLKQKPDFKTWAPIAGEDVSLWQYTDPEIDDMYQVYRGLNSSTALPGDQSARVQPGATVKALGVWDTVPGLGLLQNSNFAAQFVNYLKNSVMGDYLHFHNLKLGKHIENAFHALSLTDHKSAWILAPMENPEKTTNLEQVWFPGEHEDVGGGLHNDHGITFMTLAWMMDRMSLGGKGLQYDQDYFDSQIKRLGAYYTANYKTTPAKYKAAAGMDTQSPNRDWGFGQTHDIQKTIFYWLSFSKANRSPGWYESLSSSTGVETIASGPLQNTNETVHKSVRLRYNKSYLGADDSGTFDPISLAKWYPKKQGDRWWWIWNGWGNWPPLASNDYGRMPVGPARGTIYGMPESDSSGYWEQHLQRLLGTMRVEPESVDPTNPFWKTVIRSVTMGA